MTDDERKEIKRINSVFWVVMGGVILLTLVITLVDIGLDF